MLDGLRRSRPLDTPWYRRFTLLQRFGATSLLVFLLLGFGLSFWMGRAIVNNALWSTRQAAYDDLHDRLLKELTPADLTKPLTHARYWQFKKFVDGSIKNKRTVRVKIWRRDGTVLFSDDQSIIGKRFPLESELSDALDGKLASDVSSLTASENKDERGFGRLIEVYIPIRFSSTAPVLGAFEIYQTYTPVANEIANLQRQADMMLGGGLLVLYLLLFGIVRSGSTMIKTQQRQLTNYTHDLEESYRQTIASLAAAVDARDHSTEQHSARVMELSVALGRHIQLPEAAMCGLERGAFLHDVGKIGVSDAILHKPGPLTEAEWREMRRHPEVGFTMLRGISFLEPALPLVRNHHERWDGRGYPDRLSGESIPIEARLFSVIDAYDAMTADRPYRQGMDPDVAISRLWNDAGTQFDPAMVLAFESMMRGMEVPREAGARHVTRSVQAEAG